MPVSRCRASAFLTHAHRGTHLDHTHRHFHGRSQPYNCGRRLAEPPPKLPIPRHPHYSALTACRLLHDWTLCYRQPRSVVISPLVLTSLMAISHFFLHPWERKQFLHLWLYISQTMCTMLQSAWIGFALLQKQTPVAFVYRLFHASHILSFFILAVSSDSVGFQYTSANSRAIFVPAQSSHAASCSHKTLSPQLDLFNDVQRSMLASSNVMVGNSSYLSSFTNCLF